MKSQKQKGKLVQASCFTGGETEAWGKDGPRPAQASGSRCQSQAWRLAFPTPVAGPQNARWGQRLSPRSPDKSCVVVPGLRVGKSRHRGGILGARQGHTGREWAVKTGPPAQWFPSWLGNDRSRCPWTLAPRRGPQGGPMGLAEDRDGAEQAAPSSGEWAAAGRRS